MSVHDLHDPEEARLFLLQGLWLQRVLPVQAVSVPPAIEWALEVAAGGEALLPIGFIADVGALVFGPEHEPHTRREGLAVPGLPAGMARSYEDRVLGKLYGDRSFERASDAVRRYQGRDRARGMAFLLTQLRQRIDLDGVLLNPAVIKGLADRPAEELLAQGWDALGERGLAPLVHHQYEALIAAAPNVAEVLGSEDVFELEHGTALAQFSQRVALRQVLQAAVQLEGKLSRHRIRPMARRYEVPTCMLEEDAYPVGGFAALATRGSIESLLHSQLAYMESDERPDLFDIKYLRDELLYYARDDNQFLRRRRSYLMVLYPDLTQARFKDAQLPWQRIVLLLAFLVTVVGKLTEWLSTEALVFELLFIEDKSGMPLAAERALVEMLLREPIANGTVVVAQVRRAEVAARCALRARRSLCHCLTAASSDEKIEADATVVTRLVLNGAGPAIGVANEVPALPEADDPLASWIAALEGLLQRWL
jgi:hypothetical protein